MKKAKLHLLLHLVDDIESLGPANGFCNASESIISLAQDPKLQQFLDNIPKKESMEEKAIYQPGCQKVKCERSTKHSFNYILLLLSIILASSRKVSRLNIQIEKLWPLKKSYSAKMDQETKSWEAFNVPKLKELDR